MFVFNSELHMYINFDLMVSFPLGEAGICQTVPQSSLEVGFMTNQIAQNL